MWCRVDVLTIQPTNRPSTKAFLLKETQGLIHHHHHQNRNTMNTMSELNISLSRLIAISILDSGLLSSCFSPPICPSFPPHSYVCLVTSQLVGLFILSLYVASSPHPFFFCFSFFLSGLPDRYHGHGNTGESPWQECSLETRLSWSERISATPTLTFDIHVSNQSSRLLNHLGKETRIIFVI